MDPNSDQADATTQEIRGGPSPPCTRLDAGRSSCVLALNRAACVEVVPVEEWFLRQLEARARWVWATSPRRSTLTCIFYSSCVAEKQSRSAQVVDLDAQHNSEPALLART